MRVSYRRQRLSSFIKTRIKASLATGNLMDAMGATNKLKKVSGFDPSDPITRAVADSRARIGRSADVHNIGQSTTKPSRKPPRIAHSGSCRSQSDQDRDECGYDLSISQGF